MEIPTYLSNTRVASQVSTAVLVPEQAELGFKTKTATNCFQQVMLKHPRLSYFKSKSQLLYAALLEADTDVISYTPHPFKMTILRKPYVPHFYVLRRSSGEHVVELRRRAKLSNAMQTPLEQYFKSHNMAFAVIDSQKVYNQEIEAMNWLDIVRRLHLAREIDTCVAESELLNRFHVETSLRLHELVTLGARESSYINEIALLRMLHRGAVKASLSSAWLDYDTEFSLCI